eukprot:TRINITY_DN8354_c0_g1_i1.p1 TRINITY_DN8354_c0_g1~~TRINITY_DN8354_c0_g1_i1.p1  ORF type:complete len:747 (+),score=155.76 TRINITY_DN8354_c0_g1_i1:121-2361(+)
MARRTNRDCGGYFEAPIQFCSAATVANLGGVAGCCGSGAVRKCLICCVDEPRFVAVGRCGHTEVCGLCSVRLRGVLRDFHCPLCKEDLTEVFIGRDATSALALASAAEDGGGGRGDGGGGGARGIASAIDTRRGDRAHDGSSSQRRRAPIGPPTGAVESQHQEELRDSRLGMVFGDVDIRNEIQRLLDYRCWFPHCVQEGTCFATLAGLSSHLRQEHRRQFCETCLRGRKVFLHEQLLYSVDDMERHRLEGDGAQTIGRDIPPIPAHAHCGFCKRYLYCQEDLVDHMHRHHQLCVICERKGRHGEFYRDYGSLSLHYEEQHYVCKHEACMKGRLRLVAFSTEDELLVHEASEHSSQLSQKARKQGVRLNVQMGATSYRDEQERRRQQQADSTSGSVSQSQKGRGRGRGGLSQQAVVGDSGGDLHVRFMWTRGQPPSVPTSGEWGPLFDGRRANQSEEEEELYPRRSVANSNPSTSASAPASASTASRHVSHAVPASRSAATANATSAQVIAPEVETAKAASIAAEAASADSEETVSTGAITADAAALLDAALAHTEEVGLDSASGLDRATYKERNHQFKVDLQQVLGTEQVAEFKAHSAHFRSSLAQSGEASGATQRRAVVLTYAERVLEVFLLAHNATDKTQVAVLLSDLVVLLPDPALRHSLHEELRGLSERRRAKASALQSPSKKVALDTARHGCASGGTSAGEQRLGPAASPPTAVTGSWRGRRQEIQRNQGGGEQRTASAC